MAKAVAAAEARGDAKYKRLEEEYGMLEKRLAEQVASLARSRSAEEREARLQDQVTSLTLQLSQLERAAEDARLAASRKEHAVAEAQAAASAAEAAARSRFFGQLKRYIYIRRMHMLMSWIY